MDKLRRGVLAVALMAALLGAVPSFAQAQTGNPLIDADLAQKEIESRERIAQTQAQTQQQTVIIGASIVAVGLVGAALIFSRRKP